jgi:transmembrane sensor
MEQDIPWIVLEKIFSNQASDSEQILIKQWLVSEVENKLIYNQLHSYYLVNKSLPLDFNPNLNEANIKIWENNPSHQKITRNLFFRNNLIWKVAAVIVFIIAGWWIIQQKDPFQIRLTQISTSDSVQTDIVLTDGTHVWLNYGSELKFSKEFKNNRNIYLKGEAYFEVTRDTLHPFVVSTGKTQIRVLGTKFNINSYKENVIDNVIVNEGKVSYMNNNKNVMLLAGDKGCFYKQSGELIKTKNNDPNFLSWKTKVFVFDNQSLKDVFKTLASVYHFKYKIVNPLLNKKCLSGKYFQRPINEIILTISTTLDLNINFLNDQYVIDQK